MGVTNNFYLLSKSRTRKKDIEKIKVSVEELSKGWHRRIIEQVERRESLMTWNLSELKSFLTIGFNEINWFIGDEDYFFYENEDDKIEIIEWGEEELKQCAICPQCKFNLYNKVIEILIKKFKNRPKLNQNNFPFECQEGLQCSNCGLIINVDKLTGRKIIGNFRIELHNFLFDYLNGGEIVSYFDSDEKDDFYIEQYMYP